MFLHHLFYKHSKIMCWTETQIQKVWVEKGLSMLHRKVDCDLVSCLLFTIFQSKGKISQSKPLLKRKVILRWLFPPV